MLSSLPALVGYFRREKPSAALSFIHYANIFALLARRFASYPHRLVVTEHNTLSIEFKHSTGLKSFLMPILINLFYRWSDGIVAVSDGVADDLSIVARIPRERIQVIYNPVVTPQLRDKMQAPLEDPWYGDGDPPVILAVGSLREQKGFSILIEAFALVRRIRSARLLILGEGVDRPKLEALVKRLNLEKDVRLPGFILNPYPYMARASLFVLSSNWEGLPTVLIEALYCGVPVVATDCFSGPREILRNGRFGQLVPVGDKALLAKAIEESLSSRASIISSKSWEPFEMESVINNYLRILLGT
jgi:glycosyltransferase involved in cell wall biosynthesis